MLKQRIITAIVLLAVLLPALFHPRPEPFVLLTLLLIAAGAWEWGRLNGCSTPVSWALGLLCGLACAGSWWWGGLVAVGASVWLLAGAFWVLGGAALLRAGVPGWPRVPRAIRLPLGLLALWLAWLAVAQARVLGVNFLLSAMALVWTADISAYFAGRRFGGRFTRGKLAPGISPGKSWEGVWGGMAGVGVLAALWIAVDRSTGIAAASLYTRLLDGHPLLLVVALPFLTAMSVVGDLVESLIKRSAGVKDSSNLLPGHGGVLDRVDALLPTMPLVMMLMALGGAR